MLKLHNDNPKLSSSGRSPDFLEADIMRIGCIKGLSYVALTNVDPGSSAIRVRILHALFYIKIKTQLSTLNTCK
jgi:hypothetical protein